MYCECILAFRRRLDFVALARPSSEKEAWDIDPKIGDDDIRMLRVLADLRVIELIRDIGDQVIGIPGRSITPSDDTGSRL